MATNLARLKTKGRPPAAEAAVEVIADPRPETVPAPAPRPRPAAEEKQRPLQVRVPEAVFLEFSEAAAREYGFTHGAKKQLFLKMWEAWKAR